MYTGYFGIHEIFADCTFFKFSSSHEPTEKKLAFSALFAEQILHRGNAMKSVVFPHNIVILTAVF